MSHGRTYWWAKDAGWWRREWIVELGMEFGADGPAVIDWLACEAKAQNDGGLVSAGIKTVSRGCFVDVVTVCPVLSRAVTLGLLEEYEERQGRFTCRISGWTVEQGRHSERERKANWRARQSIDTGDSPPEVTPRPVVSRDVPECPPTGQDRTGHIDNAKALSTNVESPESALVSEVFDYWRDRCGHNSAKLTADRRSKVRARLRDGYTLEQIRQAINGAARAAFVNDAGQRFDDLELICRSGSKLEDFIARATATPSVSKQGAASRMLQDAGYGMTVDADVIEISEEAA